MPDSSNNTGLSFSLFIKPGSASAVELAELLYEISKLNKKLGGTGITWEVVEATLVGVNLVGRPK